MKTKTILIICLSLLTHFATAQINLEEELRNVVDSSSIYIENGRKLMIANARQGNFTKSIELLKFLKGRIDEEDYYILYPYEERLLCFMAQDKSMFLDALKKDEWDANKIMPPNDQLGTVFIQELEKELPMWAGWIDELDLTAEEHDIYRLYLGQINFYQDKLELHKETKQFVRKYNESEYQSYAKSLYDDFLTGSMGFAFSYGPGLLTGEVTDFVDLSGMLTMEMDFFINRYYWSLWFGGTTIGETKVDLYGTTDDGTEYLYNAGNYTTSFSAGLKFGYLLYKGKRLKVYPYSILGGGGISVSHQNTDIEQLNLTDGLCLGGGMGFDYDIFSWDVDDLYSSYNSHLGIRFNIAYQQVLSGKDYPTNGMAFATAGLVWWLGD